MEEEECGKPLTGWVAAGLPRSHAQGPITSSCLAYPAYFFFVFLSARPPALRMWEARGEARQKAMHGAAAAAGPWPCFPRIKT